MPYKTAKIVSALLLLAAEAVSVDLGLNCLVLAVPELQDGVAYHKFSAKHIWAFGGYGGEQPDRFFLCVQGFGVGDLCDIFRERGPAYSDCRKIEMIFI